MPPCGPETRADDTATDWRLPLMLNRDSWDPQGDSWSPSQLSSSDWLALFCFVGKGMAQASI